MKRETLYAEFIIEASKRFTKARTRHAETPEVVAGYSSMERKRLTSSTEVIRVAEQMVRRVLEAYSEANKTFDKLRELVRNEDEFDPLRNFAEACRTELHALRG